MSATHGSPPRAWGQSLGCCLPETFQRFTPTGVGTIKPEVEPNHSEAVHPHGRGDNQIMEVALITTRGSPPRAWGQSGDSRVRSALFRFTPTGVGTILSLRVNRVAVAVHPHGRGDNVCCAMRERIIRGSPPRAWGQLRVRPCVLAKYRFTPTGVGTILSLRANLSAVAVHPHGRGDNLQPAR